MCKLLGLFLSLLVVSQPLTAMDGVDFPYSEDMNVTLVAQEMVVNGLPMKAYQFHSQKSIDEITQYYAEQWADLNDVKFGEWRILSHRQDGYLFTVQFEKESSLMTHGLLGISPLFDMMEESDREIDKKVDSIGKGFVLPPNSEVINDIKSVDLGKHSRTVVYRNQLSIGRNYQYFKTQYLNKGWLDLLAGSAANKDSQALAMNKNGQELNVSFSKSDGFTYGVAIHVK